MAKNSYKINAAVFIISKDLCLGSVQSKTSKNILIKRQSKFLKEKLKPI